MKNFLKILVIFSFIVSIISCSKEDDFSEKTLSYEDKYFGESRYNFWEGLDLSSQDKLFIFGQPNIGLEEDTSSNSDEIFLNKYNYSGIKQWSEGLGVSDNESGITSIINSFGEVYIAGYSSLGQGERNNSDSFENFLMKYNSLGIKQWVKKFGISSSIHGMEMNFDSLGNIYVSGSANIIYEGKKSLSGDEFFLMKFNSSGTEQWVRNFGLSESKFTFYLNVDFADNIILTGYKNINFNVNPNKFEEEDFLIKYNSDGTLIK